MLTLTGVRKTFPLSFKPALDSINLTLHPGDFCVIIGSNGSGKSTLLKAISGEYTVDEGTIVLAEKNITTLPVYKRSTFISSVTQDITLGTIPAMTVLENMALSSLRAAKAGWGSYQDNLSHYKQALTKVNLGLEEMVERPLAMLSGGQRQAIAMVMATMCTPKLLLLDEHCSALDPRSSTSLMEYTEQVVAERGITTLMITHNLHDAVRYGNRLIMLQQGRIVMDMSKEEKQKLTTSSLIDTFHHFEDMLLLPSLSGGVSC